MRAKGRLLVLFVLSVTLVACDGSSSGKSRDTTAPVITLIGADPQVIEAGTAYVELGATASDNRDGDLSSAIVIDASQVDTSSPGTYSVSYNVSDSAGNAAVTMTRIVVCEDTTPPVITLVGNNPQVIEACSMSYAELGATAWDFVDGDLTASIVIDASSVDTDVHDDYWVTYDVTDAAGNRAATVTRDVRVVLPKPSDDQLYGVDSGTDSLFRIDAASGAGCYVGRLDPAGDSDPNRTPNRFATPIAMAIDAGGNLFAINNTRCFVPPMQEEGECHLFSEHKTELVSIDPLSGTGISVSDPNGANTSKIGLTESLAFDPVTNAIYGVGIYVMQPPGEGTLTLIDTIEGDGIPVGRILADQASMRIFGADYDPCGNLYAVTADGVLIRLDAEKIALADSDTVPDMRAEIIGLIPLDPAPGSIVFDRNDRLLGTLIDGKFFEIDTTNADVTHIGTLSNGNQGLGYVFDSSVPRVCKTNIVNVVVDLKLGVNRNPGNLGSRDEIQVVVLTSDSFDATQADWKTVRFGPGEAKESHERSHIHDVDYDGDMDVVLHFAAQETGIGCRDSNATLIGETFASEAFFGTDSIATVKCPIVQHQENPRSLR
jgi:PKD repeat protein